MELSIELSIIVVLIVATATILIRSFFRKQEIQDKMSKISLNLNHDGLLWTTVNRDDEHLNYVHEYNGTTISFGDFGVNVACEIQINEEEQEALVRCLAKENIPFVPHWQTLTVDLHQTVQRIEKEVWNAALLVDHCFRKSPKGIRLTPLKLPVAHINQSQAFPVMRWQFSDEEKTRLNPILNDFNDQAKHHYQNGIMIPFSVAFDQKQIFLRSDEVEEIFAQIDSTDEIPPFWTLYGIAWENFSKNKSYDSAILILGTAIETGLKWCLKEKGDEIAKFLIEKVQSPSLDNLYACALDYTDYNFPDHFKGWLKQLVTARNFVAHKPRSIEIDVLQIARWFAVGEAILKSLLNKENDPLVGYLIEPTGKKKAENFSANTRGVILRREKYQNSEEEQFHVVLGTGESWYFSENTFEKLPNKQQKFPDVV